MIAVVACSSKSSEMSSIAFFGPYQALTFSAASLRVILESSVRGIDDGGGIGPRC